MIVLNFFFKIIKFLKPGLARVFILFLGLLMPAQIFAFDITVSAGKYTPEDSAVRDMYDTSTAASIQLNIPYYKSFDWILRYNRLRVESKVKGIKSEADFDILNLGVEKLLIGNKRHIVEPFFAFGVSGIRIEATSEDVETDGETNKDTDGSIGTFWDVGILGQIFSSAWLEFRISEQYVKERVFNSSVNLSGQIVSLGLRVRF